MGPTAAWLKSNGNLEVLMLTLEKTNYLNLQSKVWTG